MFRKYNYDIAKELLDKHDSPDGRKDKDGDVSFIEKLTTGATRPSRTIVGIDIYKYSTLEFPRQSAIPFIFDLLRYETIKTCKEYDGWIFQNIGDDFIKENFISTGDGGFQILTDPFQAICYIMHFESNLRSYNAGLFYPKLREIGGELSLRYCATNDRVIRYGNNWFGPGIINNARILSKDSLNRCLIDSNCVSWFVDNFNGVETLPLLNLDDVSKLSIYKDRKNNDLGGLLMSRKTTAFIHVGLAKIGDIKAKSQEMHVYSLFVQAKYDLTVARPGKPITQIMVSVGNTNASGIS